MAEKKKKKVQVYNPTTKKWVKIDKETGKIVAHKKSPGPYKKVPKHRSSPKKSQKR
jgi:hypothetical protein